MCFLMPSAGQNFLHIKQHISMNLSNIKYIKLKRHCNKAYTTLYTVYKKTKNCQYKHAFIQLFIHLSGLFFDVCQALF